MVKVDVEYCGYCDFSRECRDLAAIIKETTPDVEVKCRRGRKGAFEIKIDGFLLYSKIAAQSETFPDFRAIATNVKKYTEGQSVPTMNEAGRCAIM